MSSKNPFSDPSTGANLLAPQANKGEASAKNPFTDPNLGIEPTRSAGDFARDAAAWGLKGAIGIPEAAVGLADLVTGGKAGKVLENEGGSFGLRFKQAKEVVNDLHSDAYKLRQQQLQDADGILEKGKVAIANPSLVVGGIVESLPSMIAGGAVGRGLLAATRLGQMGAKGAAIAGGAGEGVVGAGSAAEQIRQQTDDGELTAKQAGLAAATGLATGALGFAGNKVANRLGIGDADMMLAQGTKGMAKHAAERATTAAVNPLAAPAQKSILRQMGEGAIAEGVLEELPQSVSEQVLQNEALGKPWSEGLDEAVVMGILTGGAMGAGAAGYRGYTDKQLSDATSKAMAEQKAAQAAGGAAVEQASAPVNWSTSPGAASAQEGGPGTTPASPANAPNLDYETLPGAAAAAVGKEIPFERDFDTGGLSLQSTAPASDAPVLDHEALRDRAGLMMPPQLDTGRIEVDTGLSPLSNAQPERQWDTGNLQLLGEGQSQEQAPLSQHMGLNPKAGALSKAAAMAVDSGASPVVQPQSAPVAEQAPLQQQAVPQVPAGVDPETGEISLQAQMDEIKGHLDYLRQQAVGQGWNKEMVAQRNALQTQLTKMEVQAAAGKTRGASTTGAPAQAQLTGINQILAKQITAMSEQELQQAIAHYGPNHKRTQKLEKALQALAQKPLEAIETGAKINVSQADKTQQGGSQLAQAGAAQASQDAAQAVAKAAKIAQEGNAEREVQRQRQLDASERWMRMTTVERQAVTATAPGLNPIARKNLHTRAWADIGEKVRDKLLDSLVKSVAAPAVKAQAAIESEAKAAPQAVSGDAPAKAAAQPVGDEKSFAAETGTLGIPRADMPQLPTANHGGMVKHLNAQGIAHETTMVDAAELKPTQAEYSPSKVEAAKSATGDRAVIVSSDGHIIDGHHQAVAAAEEGKQVKAIVLDAPVEQALAAVKASPSANAQASDAAPATAPEPVSAAPKSVPQRMKEAKAAKEAKSAAALNEGQRTQRTHATRPSKQDLAQAQELVQGQIENRERQKKEAWAKVTQLRAAVKDGTANRLQLLKAEDAHRQLVREVDGMRATDQIRFRRQETEQLAGADFDVASFLQAMNEGQPAPSGRPAAAAPAKRVRPSYSPAARAEAVRAVTGTADAIRQAWANGPEVIVAFDMQDPVVPESARRADLRQRSGGAQGAPEGFYYQGKVYLMASKLKTPNDAARVLFHEALGHHGLRGLFGKDLGLILNQVATMRKADVDAKIEEYGLRRVNRLDRRTAAEEVLAEMAQSTPQIGFVRRAVAAIRTWLRTHVPGFKSLALTDAELIRNYILPARAWVENGGVSGNLNGVASFSREGAPELRAATNFLQARQAVKAFQGKELVNAATGMTAMVSRNTLDKMLSSKAVQKSETPATHSMAVANADTLFEQAILGWSKPDRADDLNIKAVHRFFAPMVVDGRTKLVKLTVKETTLDRANSLYTLEAVELNETLPAKEWVEAAAREDGVSIETKNPLQRGVGPREIQQAGSRETLAQPHGVTLGRSAEDVLSLAQAVEQSNTDEPMFSRIKISELKNSALDQLSKTFSHPGKVSWWDKSVGTMRHLAERNPLFKPVFEAAQQFIDDVSTLANEAAAAAPRLMPRVETMGDVFGRNRKKPVSAGDNQAVAKPLFEGTLMWARDVDGTPTLVDDLSKKYANLSAFKKSQILLRAGRIDENLLNMWQGLPVAMYEANINSRFASQVLKPGVVWSDAELKSIFKINDHQASLYQEARAGIDRSIDITARADMLRAVGDEFAGMRDAVMDQETLEDARDLLTDMLQMENRANPDAGARFSDLNSLVITRYEKANELMKQGYAPLMRFGKYKVYVKGSDGESIYFGLYESKSDSNKAMEEMAKEYPDATITQGTMSDDEYKLFAGITPETLEQFGNMLGLKDDGQEAQDKAFQDYIKLAKNNHSALKRMIHRKGTAGFNEDVGRVLASFVYSNARMAAGGLNAGAMDKSIKAIPQEQGELKDVAMGLRSYIQDPQEEGQAVRGFLFAQYLGGSVASAAVNMTQPFAVTLPWLSQYGGIKKAGAQMAKALRDMGTRGFQYEADLAKALQAAEDDGTVSPQEVHQLMAQARGAGGMRSGDGTRKGDSLATASNVWEKTKVVWGQPFALAEQFNRRSTFIASYRIAKEQGMGNPGEFARKAVLETQFLYSKANKMRWARGPVGGTLMTFKTYSVSYLELMQRMWTQGGPEGKRAVGWALAMLLLMSGAGGVPFIEDAEDLIDGAGQMMGYNLMSKQVRKEFLESTFGRELAEFMNSGVSGLPGSPIDLGRLGMGNLIPGTGLALNKPNRMRDLLELAGPAGDLVSRGFSGAGSVLKGVATGDLGAMGQGVMEVMPGAARNLAKGADMAASGMYKDTKGYKVMDTTLDEALFKMIGFQPKSVAEDSEVTAFQRRTASFYTQQSSEIKAQWADALFRKDEAAVQKVRARLADWNRNNPDQPITVKIPEVWKKVREMGKDRTQRIAEAAPKALREQMRLQAAEVRG